MANEENVEEKHKDEIQPEEPEDMVVIETHDEDIENTFVQHVTNDRNGNKIVTMSNGDQYTFGRPKLKHRKLIGTIISSIQSSEGGKEAAQKIADKRKITLMVASKLQEDELDDEEKGWLSSSVSLESISDVLTESIYVTLRKAPWQFATQEDIEDKMNYEDGLKLLKYAIDIIKDAILASAARKN